VGVIWFLDVCAPVTGADGAHTLSSRAGEGPDDAVRHGDRRSNGAGPYDSIARRCGCIGLTPPETDSRTAARSSTRRRWRHLHTFIDLWRLPSDVNPHSMW
jgi:hypothetical protein